MKLIDTDFFEMQSDYRLANAISRVVERHQRELTPELNVPDEAIINGMLVTEVVTL
ncbi:hypothetical protein ACGY1D_13490 [Burkholderia pseudomallei]